MKKMKLAVLASALVGMLGLSSCLGGGDYENSYPGADFVQVSGYLGMNSLVNQYGFEYIPSDKTILEKLESGRYAYISYSYDPALVDPSAKSLNVQLYGYTQLTDENPSTIPSTPTEEAANAPVYDVSSPGEYLYPTFFKLNDLFIPLVYYVKQTDDDDEWKEELAAHSFALYYDAATDFKDGEMTLHLRHKIQNFDEEDNKTRTRRGYEYRHYSLIAPLSEYRSAHEGKNPDKIIIEFEQNTYDATYGGSSVRSNTYQIDYKEVVDNYNELSGNANSSSIAD